MADSPKDPDDKPDYGLGSKPDEEQDPSYALDVGKGALVRAARRRQLDRERREEFSEQIAAWLTDKWGEERPCPYCDHVVFRFDPTPVAIARAGEAVYFPAFAVSCENCGQTVFIPAEAIGIEVGHDEL